MQNQIPPPDGNLSNKPDKDTRRGMDMTGADADNRVLFIDVKLFKYGTADHARAASICLSVILLFLGFVLSIIGLWATNNSALERSIFWISSAFFFVSGVCIGKGGTNTENKSE